MVAKSKAKKNQAKRIMDMLTPKKTGSELLEIAVEKVNGVGEKKMIAALERITKDIKLRNMWIKNRTEQNEKLQDVQDEIIKLYDAGKLDDSDLARLMKRVSHLEGQTVTSMREYDDENRY